MVFLSMLELQMPPPPVETAFVAAVVACADLHVLSEASLIVFLSMEELQMPPLPPVENVFVAALVVCVSLVLKLRVLDLIQ